MSDLIAKPIIQDQYWVVTDGERKVGNVVANSAGYEVKLNGSFLQFNNTDELKHKTNIKFQPLKLESKAQLPVIDYPTPSNIYNYVYDVKRKLHLFTDSENSKCLRVAGYFAVDMNGNKTVEFCPKYIFIQRYEYRGPYKTDSEANSQLNTL